MGAGNITLAIVVCTFKRPDSLRSTLRSIAAQKSCISTDCVHVYVVDNSDEGGARAVVDEASIESPWPMIWLEAHPPNISVARNAGVRAGREDFVAFVDDDQTLEPGWLEAVSRVFSHERGDAWLGAVQPIFETPERATPAIVNLFERELAEPFGHELFAFGPKKLPNINPATNNAIFRRATTLFQEQPFDPAYGKGGGEDYDLFCRLQRAGKRVFWAPDVRVREFVPANRCDRGYMWRRFYAGGQAYAVAVAQSASHPGLARWSLRLKALAQGFLLALRAPACLAGEAARADYLFRWAGVLGKLSFGDIYPLYQPQAK